MLVEVIMSVMLLSIAGIALLKVNSNQKKIYTIVNNKFTFSNKASIVLNEHSIDLHQKKINFYDTLKQKYTIKNNKLAKILKNSSIEYSQKYKSIVKLATGEDDKSLSISIDEIKIYNKSGTSRYLTVYR